MDASSVLNNKGFRMVLVLLNLGAIIGVFVTMGLTGGINPDTRKELNARAGIILGLGFVVMITWLGISLSLFATSTQATIYYIFIMLALCFALSLSSVAIASLAKM